MLFSVRSCKLRTAGIKEKITTIENEMHLKFNDIHQALNYLLQKGQQDKEQKERKPIGFK